MVRYKCRKRKLQRDVVHVVEVRLPSAAGHQSQRISVELCRTRRETVIRHLDVHYQCAAQYSVPFRSLREMKVVSHIVAKRFGEEMEDVYRLFSMQWGNRRRRYGIRGGERGRPTGPSPADPCYEQWLQEQQLLEQRMKEDARRMKLQMKRWAAETAFRREQAEQLAVAEAKEKQMVCQVCAFMNKLRFSGVERQLAPFHRCSPELSLACTKALELYEEECRFRRDINRSKISPLVAVRKETLQRGCGLFTWLCSQLNNEQRAFLRRRSLLSIVGDAAADNVWSAALTLDECIGYLGLRW